MVQEQELEVARRLEFHGVAYVATVGVAQQQLHVQVEVAADDAPCTLGASSAGALPPPWSCWAGSFPSACALPLTHHQTRVAVRTDSKLSLWRLRACA